MVMRKRRGMQTGSIRARGDQRGFKGTRKMLKIYMTARNRYLLYDRGVQTHHDVNDASVFQPDLSSSLELVVDLTALEHILSFQCETDITTQDHAGLSLKGRKISSGTYPC